MDDCVALEGSYFYFSYSWYAGEWPSHDSFARNMCTTGQEQSRFSYPLLHRQSRWRLLEDIAAEALLEMTISGAGPCRLAILSLMLWPAGEWSAGPRVVKWLGNGTSDGRTNKYDMRYHANCSHVVKDSSWHCTDCFATIAQTKSKISSFLHHEMDRCAATPAGSEQV